MMFISPNPGLVPITVHLYKQVREDATNGLWTPLNLENPDHITPKTLTDLFVENFDKIAFQKDFFSTARAAKDFSLIAMLAIQTGQWQRKDLHPLLMTLQHKAETVLPTPKTRYS